MSSPFAPCPVLFLSIFNAIICSPITATAQSVTPVVFPNDPAPGGGTYSGIDFAYPVTAPDGSVFFKDSSIPTTVGFPGMLQTLDVQSSTISGLGLASGEALNLNDLALLSSPSPGTYFIRVSLTPASAGSVIITGTAGNFTKVIKTGDTLPSSGTLWTAMRFSPSFYAPTVGVTRAGQPIIDSIAPDDSSGSIGIYRNSAWEMTPLLGVDVPGFATGSRFRPGTTDMGDVKGNGNGQFVLSNSVFSGTSNSATLLGQASFLGQNGTLQLIAKTLDVLPGDSRQIASPRTSSINDVGTVALAGNYLGSGAGAGWVYRWSAAGGASKVVSEGDPLPSVGPRAVFTGINGFQFPLINSSGALLFFGEVNLYGNRDSSIGRRLTLLYQSSPGAAIQMVLRHGASAPGLPTGSVVGLNNSDVLTFNDAGQYALNSLSSIPQNNGTAPVTIFGGLAPGASVLARVGTPLNVNGRSGSSVFSSIISVPTVKSGQVTGEFNSSLSSAGSAHFRGVLSGAGGFFGQSGVFRAELSGTASSNLAAQTIAFSPPRNVVANAPGLTLSASSSSGLPVSFSIVSGPATSMGNTLNFTSATGDVVVRASQAGNGSFLAAESVDRKFTVVATATSLPYISPALITPLALPGYPAAGGGTYSGVDFERPHVTANGEITFKDAVTADVVRGEGTQARLNLYQSTIAGLTLNAGEQLDRVNPRVLSRSLAGDYLLRVPVTTATDAQEVLVSGTPGNFTKILRTGDALPGTSSVWTYDNNIIPLPKTTRGGDPMVYATSTNGFNTHLGIYRNSAWEITQIRGTVPPGYSSNTKFNNEKFTAANQAGQFLFSSEVIIGTSLQPQSLFLGQNGTKQLITSTVVGATIGGDIRQILTAFAFSINSSGTAMIHGDYRPISGNSNQGGFLYRWSSAGGFSKVATRGDPLPGINSTAKFYTALSEPLINDNGAVLFFASVDLPGTGAGNYTSALLYQSAPGAAIQKVALTGDAIVGLPSGGTISFNSLDALQFNNAGQFALFAGATVGSPHSTIYGGTAPDIAVIASARLAYIDGIQGPKSLGTFTSGYPNVSAAELNGVAGEFGARISNNGLIPFRSSYAAIGVTTNDTGVFVADLNLPPAPVPVAQTITFPSPSDQLINSSFALAGNATSGLSINYQILSGPASISGSNIVLAGTPGLVTIRANQAGNATFLAALPVDRSFRVVATSAELGMVNYLAAANVTAANRLSHLDLDNDGLSNLLEFALGGNPLLPSQQLLPSASLLNGQFRFTYTRAQQGNVDYLVTVSGDLGTGWNSVGVSQGTVDGSGNVVATIPIVDSSRFLRLEVTLKP
jgi:hypothetical protein